MQAEFSYLKKQFPEGGLFRDKSWRLSPRPVTLEASRGRELERIGEALYAFSTAANRLYFSDSWGECFRYYLDRGKPQELLDVQSAFAIRNQVPQLIRPDLLLTERGWRLVEIDSLPGGIGTLDLLDETYRKVGFEPLRTGKSFTEYFAKLGTQFAFSEEGMAYEPEMRWLAARTEGASNVHLQGELDPIVLAEAEQVYRYFELWDTELTKEHRELLRLAAAGELKMTPPPKAFLEEKLLLALYWLPDLRKAWSEQLCAQHLAILDELIPMSWVLDPQVLPENTVQHHTELWSWDELKDLSQKERRLVIKISGFSETAWGSRGVHIGHDESRAEWQRTVDAALEAFEHHPHLLQPFENALKFAHDYYRDDGSIETLESVARYNPYYQVENDEVRIASVMAVVCPGDKKKIHGMNDASLVPCVVG